VVWHGPTRLQWRPEQAEAEAASRGLLRRDPFKHNRPGGRSRYNSILTTGNQATGRDKRRGSSCVILERRTRKEHEKREGELSRRRKALAPVDLARSGENTGEQDLKKGEARRGNKKSRGLCPVAEPLGKKRSLFLGELGKGGVLRKPD